MSEASLEPPKAERRRTPRKRVVLRGKVVYGEGAYTVDCMIRNISPKGARITVEKGVGIPSCLHLIDLSSGQAHAAEVTSINGFSFGLRFLRTHALSGSNDPDLKFLKHIWLNCAR